MRGSKVFKILQVMFLNPDTQLESQNLNPDRCILNPDDPKSRHQNPDSCDIAYLELNDSSLIFI